MIIVVFILFFSIPLSQLIIPELHNPCSYEFGCSDDLEERESPEFYNFIHDLLVNSKIHYYLSGVIHEYHEGYNDGCYEMADYLNQNGNKNDTVYCTEFALVRPLMFLTEMQVISFSPGEGRYKELFPDITPDFIIPNQNGIIYDETWKEYAKTDCKEKTIQIHKPFRGWDASRPSTGLSLSLIHI